MIGDVIDLITEYFDNKRLSKILGEGIKNDITGNEEAIKFIGQLDEFKEYSDNIISAFPIYSTPK